MTLYGTEHVERYRATEGKEGHAWNGTQTLLLTTTGRRSGEPRTAPLIYDLHRGDHIIVASKGGADEPPGWYVNLEANPEVEVQVMGDVYAARARTARPDERAQMWPKMVAEWPDYDEYQKKTAREIAIVVLERAGVVG